MHALVEAGADIIELGVPFSDPMADGPVIQRASERALARHVALHDVIDLVGRFRQTNQTTPVVLMGYLNPLEVMGYEAFAETAAAAGVDGVLTVDIPPEEAEQFVPAMKTHGIDPIFLLAPTSNRARIERITAVASGFVYYVSLKGVTGAANLSLDSVRDKLEEIRACTTLPVGVGFGIKDAATAAQMAGIADAVVVGSALVSRIEANADDPERAIAEVRELLSEMRTAMDAA
jgi:tryptophan synthase alpha chain